MSRRPAVLLLHRQTHGEHYDWMLEDPLSPPTRGQLVTFRLAMPADQWHAAKHFDLQRLTDHRREYLQYEGPLSGDRGHVQRTDSGWYRVRLWSPMRMVIDVRMHTFAGAIELAQVRDDQWRAVVIATAS